MSRAFLDTNVLVYAVSQGDPRERLAMAALAEGGVIGLQCLNEFAAVARRKLGFSWDEVRRAVASFLDLSPAPQPLTLAAHQAALGLAARHGFHIYDALIVAAALQAGCDRLLTEDLQDGLVIEGRLTVRNPFAEMSPR